MYLHSLTLHGFKSFADKTVIKFTPGVTGIVGPNGCGKSNVVDAVRWVLGETSAKALRGGEMADVIFNGTESRKSVGMAEVTLTLGDCDSISPEDSEKLAKIGALGIEDKEGANVSFNQIAITRRVYKDGRSEYLLNGQTCRLKDIHGMLMDTGIGRTAYSIMEQGKMDLLLSSKPEDRRAVFEEAAGITKFKSQKKDALRKLDYTEANLLRVDDILAEVKRQMGSLQRQAQKAKRYQTVMEDVQVLDSNLAYRSYSEMKAEREELLNSSGSIQKELEQMRSSVLHRENSIKEQRGELEAMDHRKIELEKKKRELQSKVESSQSRISYNEERLADLEQQSEQYREEASKMAETISRHQGELNEVDGSLQIAEESIGKQEQTLRTAEESHDALQKQRLENRQKLEELRSRLEKVETEEIAAARKLESKQSSVEAERIRIDQIQHELVRIEEERSEFTRQLDEVAQRSAAWQSDLDKERAELEVVEKELSTLERKKLEQEVEQSTRHREISKLESRAEVLSTWIETGEGLGKGTQLVLSGLGEPERFADSVQGMLGSYLEVKESYTQAIEAVLGHHLKAVIVENEERAAAMLEVLCEKGEGRAGFLPDTLLPAPELPLQKPLPNEVAGNFRWARDTVQVDGKGSGVIDYLLADVLIVENLHQAVRLRANHSKLTFVTKDGTIIEPSGLIRGGKGSSQESSLIERQRELKEIKSTLKKEAEQSKKVQEEIEQANTQAAEKKAIWEGLEKSAHQKEVSLSTLLGKKELLEQEQSQTGISQERLSLEFTSITQKNSQILSLISDLESSRESLLQEKESLRQEVSKLEETDTETNKRESESAEHIAQLRTAFALEKQSLESIQEKKTPITERLEELQLGRTRREDSAKGCANKSEATKGENTELSKTIEESCAQLKGLLEQGAEVASKRDALYEGLRTVEEQIEKGRVSLRELEQQAGKEEVEGARLELREENLQGNIRERYSVDLLTFEPDSHDLLLRLQKLEKARVSNEKRAASRAAAVEGIEAAEEGVQEEEQAEDATDDSAQDINALEGEPDWEMVKGFVADLKARLDSMGSVNLDAIDEFTELEERHSFLQQQYDDLTNSKKELLQVISKINRETKILFSDTFEKVRVNFKQTFKDLFGNGAKAELSLIDDDNPLESGIDIVAKPPGKKLQSISLLSGGERSMTAVALLFSIYMVKPSPFCILDELDAPLDESNIGRFIKMLDQFTDKSQFIIVTHNKRTMSRAEVIFGVTMEEFGVSKLVGVDMKRGKNGADNYLESKNRKSIAQEEGAEQEESAEQQQEAELV